MKTIQVLVISLAGSDARQAKVRSELSKTQFPWSFLDAIRGFVGAETFGLSACITGVFGGLGIDDD